MRLNVIESDRVRFVLSSGWHLNSGQVSLDLVKSLYAKFIDWDVEMYDLETGTPPHAANGLPNAFHNWWNPFEDHIFPYQVLEKSSRFTFVCLLFKHFVCLPKLLKVVRDVIEDYVELLNAVATGSPDVMRFLTVMSICNTVIPQRSKNGDVSYKAQSQDEDALVHAAACLHMVLFNKTGNILDIILNGSIVQYEILDILEFTSERKRMSVVVKDCQNGEIFLLSKGADEAIFPYARTGQQTRNFVDAVEQYAQLGLRTLCLAWRELSEDDYREWAVKFKEANSTLVDREWRLAEVCQVLEQNLEILGVAAIEDRLQVEKPKGQLLLISGKTQDEVFQSLERVLLTMRITTSEPKEVAFVVDGWALEIALKHYHERLLTKVYRAKWARMEDWSYPMCNVEEETKSISL
ncbi:Phospholipid-transporting ATPase 2 [Acorus gramineus]|uniref:Phospholipid-transporting ATPase 2 n=1 Tax=Acorus gramineus TaxID=55184 RepID=A0AAV9A7G5_ACOGR|nr:Phospholipid-transporting ATPase 2 [Acorus gramineus]